MGLKTAKGALPHNTRRENSLIQIQVGNCMAHLWVYWGCAELPRWAWFFSMKVYTMHPEATCPISKSFASHCFANSSRSHKGILPTWHTHMQKLPDSSTHLPAIGVARWGFEVTRITLSFHPTRWKVLLFWCEAQLHTGLVHAVHLVYHAKTAVRILAALWCMLGGSYKRPQHT